MVQTEVATYGEQCYSVYMKNTERKTERNKEIVRKRIEEPKKWSFYILANHYGMSQKTGARTIHQIFERDITKYATKKEIERYRKSIVNTRVLDYGEVIHSSSLARMGK